MRFIVVMMALMMNVACADQTPPAAKEAQPVVVPGDSSLAMEKLQQAFPGMPVAAVEPSIVPGMFMIQVQGDWLHVTADGRFVFAGEVFELRDNEGAVSLIEERQKAVRVPALQALDPAQMITFPAKQQQAEIYVFTDVSCGYCRQLHRQVADYNSLGITIHYLAFPRGGMASAAGRVMDDIWCSENRQLAMTEAKLEKPLSQTPQACDSPVASQYELGEQFGVRGTPAVFTTEGDQLGGYLAPSRMAKALGLVIAD
ncbi:DsbC family protein [Alcanivorax sp. 1008]|uniref:DsbC family protein n=1 Tax=Alcanivorax sp. 1008 TaxID=2816853 RepID=UPI001DEA11F1|nr:DsbC family protein [Alcanivorax sp. 1008]MCC1495441.1 DsbC family protein [Alcanivorax sp. 1008]